MTNPAAGVLGDQGLRNGCSSPHFSDIDGNLVKKQHITERMTFEFRAEFFNLLNHPNFAANGTNINSSGFGKASLINFGTPAFGREIQLNARINF